MPISKIIDAELEAENRFHECLEDVPGLSAEDMKKFFDYLTRRVVIPKLNELTDAANALPDKLDKAVTRSSTSDFSPVFTVSVTTDTGVKTLSLVPSADGGGYVDGLELNGSAPLKLGGNVDVPLNVPGYVMDSAYTLHWNNDVMIPYPDGGLSDFFEVNADSPFLTLDAVLEDPVTNPIAHKITLLRSQKSTATEFTTPLLYSEEYDTLYVYVFRAGGYCSKEIML